MIRSTGPLFLGAALAAAGSTPSLAEGPRFDCARAEGAVEELICSDAGLTELDRRLADVYAAAVAKTRPPETRRLKAMQRGWVKGRNDCRKSADVRQCVEDTYRDRIVELQASYALVPSKGPFSFRCEDNSEIVVTYFATDPPSARAQRGDSQEILTIARSASGARYTGRDIQFWEKGGEARVEWGFGAKPITCRVTSG